jgi:mersacidin/lichenicidin family type 2 lantibiotic
MSPIDVVRAWKNEGYRLSLSPEQRAALPPHPAGVIELEEMQLDDVSAGMSRNTSTCSMAGTR